MRAFKSITAHFTWLHFSDQLKLMIEKWTSFTIFTGTQKLELGLLITT